MPDLLGFICAGRAPGTVRRPWPEALMNASQRRNEAAVINGTLKSLHKAA